MKKIIATILALTLIFTAAVASVSFSASAKEETVAAQKLFMEAIDEELDPDLGIDDGDINIPDMSLEEFIAAITPDNASDTLKAFIKDAATIVYKTLIGGDYPELKTASDYIKYLIEQDQEMIKLLENLKVSIGNLTEDDYKTIVDMSNENAADEDKVTVDDMKKTISTEAADESIAEAQEEIEYLNELLADENLDTNGAKLLDLAKLLSKCSKDLSVKYDETASDKFFEDYPDAISGDSVDFDDDYEFDGYDAYNAYMNNADTSYALQLYVDKANITKGQYANLKEIKALLATFSDELVEYMNENEFKNYDTLTAEVDEYITAYEAKNDDEKPADTTKKDDGKKDDTAATTAKTADTKSNDSVLSDDVNTGAAAAPISAAVVMVMAGAAMLVARKRK